MREIKWKYFLDVDNNKNNKVIINGGELNKQLEDTYFEVEILKDGSLNIEIEEVRFFFYRNKLDTIYMALRDLIYNIGDKKYIFYDEKSFRKSKIIKKNYSTIENINW